MAGADHIHGELTVHINEEIYVMDFRAIVSAIYDLIHQGCERAVEAATEKVEEIGKLQEAYGRYSDEELKTLYQRSSGNHRMAIGMLLKERGCFDEN